MSPKLLRRLERIDRDVDGSSSEIESLKTNKAKSVHSRRADHATHTTG